jgi:uncharacterized protein (TIGR03067 family)
MYNRWRRTRQIEIGDREQQVLFAYSNLTSKEDSVAYNNYENLTGTWHAAYCEVDGEMVSASYVSGIEITHKGDRFSITVQGKLEHEGTYAVNDKVEPHQITFVYTKSPNFELHKPRVGVVQLTDGTYKICIGPVGANAPSGFNTTSKSNTVLTIYEKKGGERGPVQARIALPKIVQTLVW